MLIMEIEVDSSKSMGNREATPNKNIRKPMIAIAAPILLKGVFSLELRTIKKADRKHTKPINKIKREDDSSKSIVNSEINPKNKIRIDKPSTDGTMTFS